MLTENMTSEMLDQVHWCQVEFKKARCELLFGTAGFLVASILIVGGTLSAWPLVVAIGGASGCLVSDGIRRGRGVLRVRWHWSLGEPTEPYPRQCDWKPNVGHGEHSEPIPMEDWGPETVVRLFYHAARAKTLHERAAFAEKAATLARGMADKAKDRDGQY